MLKRIFSIIPYIKSVFLFLVLGSLNSVLSVSWAAERFLILPKPQQEEVTSSHSVVLPEPQQEKITSNYFVKKIEHQQVMKHAAAEQYFALQPHKLTKSIKQKHAKAKTAKAKTAKATPIEHHEVIKHQAAEHYFAPRASQLLVPHYQVEPVAKAAKATPTKAVEHQQIMKHQATEHYFAPKPSKSVPYYQIEPLAEPTKPVQATPIEPVKKTPKVKPIAKPKAKPKVKPKPKKKTVSRKKRVIYSGETLSDVFQKVLYTNPNILSSKATESAAKSAVDQARADYYPKINANYGIGAEKSQSPGSSYSSNYARQKSLVMTETLFNGGENMASVASAKAAYKQAAHLTEEQINSIARQTTDSFLEVLRLKQLMDLAQKNVKKHVTTFDNMALRYEKGAGRLSELALARGRLARAKVTLYNTATEYRNARVAYAAIVGDMPGQLISPKIASGYLPKSLADAELEAYIHNPSLAAAKKALRVAKYAVKRATAAFSPDVSLQATLSQNQDVNAVQGQTNIYQVLLLTSYNLFNGGADLAAYKKAVKEREAALENLEATRRTVVERVKQAWNSLQNSKQRLSQLALHVESSQEVVDAYNEEFKIGKRSLLNLLDAENELFNSRSDLVNGKSTVLIDSYALMASTGTLPKYLLSN